MRWLKQRVYTRWVSGDDSYILSEGVFPLRFIFHDVSPSAVQTQHAHMALRFSIRVRGAVFDVQFATQAIEGGVDWDLQCGGVS